MERFTTWSCVRIARPQLGGQTIAFTIEQQQRMITGRREVPVAGTLLLLAMDSDLGAIQVEHHPPPQ
jgi:hypothetical protein